MQSIVFLPLGQREISPLCHERERVGFGARLSPEGSFSGRLHIYILSRCLYYDNDILSRSLEQNDTQNKHHEAFAS